jgi:hypothetical protein
MVGVDDIGTETCSNYQADELIQVMGREPKERLPTLAYEARELGEERIHGNTTLCT